MNIDTAQFQSRLVSPVTRGLSDCDRFLFVSTHHVPFIFYLHRQQKIENNSMILSATEKQSYSSVQSTCTLAPAPVLVGRPYGSHRINHKCSERFSMKGAWCCLTMRWPFQHCQMEMQAIIGQSQHPDSAGQTAFLASALFRANRPP